MVIGSARLRPIFAWWFGRLRECMPYNLRRAAAFAASVVVLEAQPGQDMVIDSLRIVRRNEALGHIPAHGAVLSDAAASWIGQTVILRVPDNLVLARSIVLPLAAEQDPEGVLRYDMDRLTPFRADQAIWRWTVARRDRAQGRLHLNLSLLPRQTIQPVEEALLRAGVRLAGVELADAGLVQLAPEASTARRIERWAWGACAALAIVGLALPFIRQSLAFNMLETQIARLQPQVRQAETLRDAITRSSAGGDVIAAERARAGDMLALIAGLTDALPDDTYLTDLSVHDGHLKLSGQSAAATKLIPALAASATLHNPSFAAPITRNETLRIDMFSIQLDAAGRAP